MTEFLQKKLSDSKAARWTVLFVVAFTMFCAYFITEVMSPLFDKLQTVFGWSGIEYGIFNWSYGWINVFLLGLFFGGMILDKLGVRITGIGACTLMIVGCSIKYYAISSTDLNTIVFGVMKMQVFIACIGFAIFAFGTEMAGITVTKAIVRWFKGNEMALAMGMQVAIARIGTGLAVAIGIPMVEKFGNVSAPILFGLVGLCIGLIAFLVFCVMDKKLDKSIDPANEEKEDPFKMADVKNIITNKGFWLIALLCLLFYSAVFPFVKFVTSVITNKYNVPAENAGYIFLIYSLGTIVLTPIFGGIYDKKGKGATIMMIGATLLIVVHLLFAMPFLNVWWFAAMLMLLLGIAFSLVPAAMWPSVPKIIPHNQLGTAYGLIFWVQNIGLSLVPLLIGWILDKYCIIGTKTTEQGTEVSLYNYSVPMLIFASFGVVALVLAYMLKQEDKKKGYGLEKPNVKN